jgi:uncharacterized membrane protein (DUF106 family)
MIDIVLILEIAFGFLLFFGLVYFAKKFAENLRRRMEEMRENFARMSPEQQRESMKELDRENAELSREDSEGDGLMLGLGSMFPPEDFDDEDEDNEE